MSESENPALSGPTDHSDHRPRTNRDWWPNQIDLSVLNRPAPSSDPLGEDFDYKAAFSTVDVAALKADLVQVMRTSQDWWPADYGHYGPLFVRLTWHAAGTYRTEDGRGGGGEGAQRFAPLNSWPDNGNLDKARRLLWPVKQKFGASVSWDDLLVLAGNVAQEDMGFTTFGFGFGRRDTWQPEEVYWGTEETWVGDERYNGDSPLDLTDTPFGAVTMGLIYVNPEGPQGNPDPLASAHDIRLTFGRMAMNDEETVALIAGGHTFGKAHGAGDPSLVGAEPEGCPVTGLGLGWKNQNGKGFAEDTVTSGLEGAWTPTPTTWDNSYWDTLFGHEWELTASPAGAKQWKPKDPAANALVPDAHVAGKTHAPMMATTDLALLADPAYRAIAERFRDDHAAFSDAYARAWFKLLHRDMGPAVRLLGPEVPEPQLWQDPVPAGTALSESQVASLKQGILSSGLSVSDLVATAWASAATFRSTDLRGGANGARIALAPQKDWAANAGAADVVAKLSQIAASAGASLADTIVIAGSAAIEKAAADAGVTVTVPVTTGRGDALQDQTDVESFAVLEPRFDGFRNYLEAGSKLSPETLLVERAYMLGLTVKQTSVLVAGLRVLGANHGGAQHGVFTDRVGVLSNDFFVELLGSIPEWKTSQTDPNVYESGNRTATAVDLVFASNSILRGIAEVYAAGDGLARFVKDFVAAWATVMDNDRFDVR